jgi:malate permease and related proteins
MENILLLFVCLLCGVFFQKIKTLPTNSYKSLNFFIIYFSAPSLVLYYIPKIKIELALMYPLLASWLCFLISFLFFYVIGKRAGWSNKLIGCLILTTGLNNTIFIGLPLIDALYGSEGLKTAIVVDQSGNSIVMNTLGVLTAVIFSRHSENTKQALLKVFTFPPFIAFAFAIVLNCMHVDFPQFAQTIFHKISATITPVALVAVGLQIKIEKLGKHMQFLVLGLFFKLLIIPAFFYFLYRIILNQNSMQIDVTIMQMAMAPMVMGALLASNFGLKPKLSAMMISVGVPLSFATLALWYYVLKFF